MLTRCWWCIAIGTAAVLLLAGLASADHFAQERAALVKGQPVVGTKEPGNANWSRREAGDYRMGNCAGLNHWNFGPCPGYYVWTKFGAGGPLRNYSDPDRQSPGGDGGASVSAPSVGGGGAGGGGSHGLSTSGGHGGHR